MLGLRGVWGVGKDKRVPWPAGGCRWPGRVASLPAGFAAERARIARRTKPPGGRARRLPALAVWKEDARGKAKAARGVSSKSKSKIKSERGLK